MTLPNWLIPPAAPSEFINHLLATDDLKAAYAWQALKYAEGRLAALDGERFNTSAPAAWQQGYRVTEAQLIIVKEDTT